MHIKIHKDASVVWAIIIKILWDVTEVWQKCNNSTLAHKILIDLEHIECAKFLNKLDLIGLG